MDDDAEVLLRVYPKRWNALVLLLVAAAFVAGGLWMTTQDGVARKGFGLSISVWGWVTLVFFGLCAAAFITSLVSRSPGLWATPNGVFLKVPFRQPRFVAWQDISLICETQQGSQSFLSIYLTDEAKAARPSGWLSRMNSRMGHGDITQSGQMLQGSITQLAVDLMVLRERFK